MILEVVHDPPKHDLASPHTTPVPQHSWMYRQTVLPVLALLRRGTSPENLAWSLALGLLVGVNPLLGSTTVLCLVLAYLFRLNLVAAQISNHAVYPLQLLLVLPFLRAGSLLFDTAPLPMTGPALLHAARSHPFELMRLLWRWEWHALVVWTAVSLVGVPIATFALTPLLRRLLVRTGAGSDCIGNVPELRDR